MANTYTQMTVHMVFSTKRRLPFIQKEDFKKVHEYISGILNNIMCKPLIVGGVEDHVHLMFELGKNCSTSEVARIVKTNSSKWIKSLNACYYDFAWQDGYSSFSVSKSIREKVSNYIANQEEHHKQSTFESEYRQFLILHEIEFNDKYLFD